MYVPSLNEILSFPIVTIYFSLVESTVTKVIEFIPQIIFIARLLRVAVDPPSAVAVKSKLKSSLDLEYSYFNSSNIYLLEVFGL